MVVEPRRRLRFTPLAGGCLTSLLAAIALYLYAGPLFETQRELFFDSLTQWVPAPPVARPRRRRHRPAGPPVAPFG